MQAYNVLELCRLPRLQVLALITNNGAYSVPPSDITDDDLSTLTASLPCLRRLKLLFSASQLTIRSIRSIGTHCRRLEHLSISIAATALRSLDESGDGYGGNGNDGARGSTWRCGGKPSPLFPELRYLLLADIELSECTNFGGVHTPATATARALTRIAPRLCVCDAVKGEFDGIGRKFEPNVTAHGCASGRCSGCHFRVSYQVGEI